MGQSQSPKPSGLSLALQGFVRSTHALILTLGLGAIGLFALASDRYPIIAYLATGFFGCCVCVVLIRYALKGPEQDRAQPSLTYSPQQLQILNFDQQAVGDLARLMVVGRQPLPPPTGVLLGSASDPNAIHLFSEEDVEQIMKISENAEEDSIHRGQANGADGEATPQAVPPPETQLPNPT